MYICDYFVRTQRKRLEIADDNLGKKLVIVSVACQRGFSAHTLNAILGIQFPDHRAVVIGQNETALDALQNGL